MSNYRVNKLHRLLCCWHVCHLHEEVAEKYKRKFSASDARGVIKINKTTSWMRKRKINKIKHRIKGEVQSKSESHWFCVNKKNLRLKDNEKVQRFPTAIFDKVLYHRHVAQYRWLHGKFLSRTPTISFLSFCLLLLCCEDNWQENQIKGTTKSFLRAFKRSWEYCTREKSWQKKR